MITLLRQGMWEEDPHNCDHSPAGPGGWVCGLPSSSLLQRCMQSGPSMASLPDVVYRAEVARHSPDLRFLWGSV